MIQHNSSLNYKTFRYGDADFCFSPDGIVLVPRATLNISADCPVNVKVTIQQALTRGWLSAVANIPEKEYMWEKLQS